MPAGTLRVGIALGVLLAAGCSPSATPAPVSLSVANGTATPIEVRVGARTFGGGVYAVGTGDTVVLFEGDQQPGIDPTANVEIVSDACEWLGQVSVALTGHMLVQVEGPTGSRTVVSPTGAAPAATLARPSPMANPCPQVP